MNRRDFLHTSGTAASALMLSHAEIFLSSSKSTTNMSNGFNLKVLATNWGFQGSIDEFCANVKKEGYDGIEIWWPDQKKEQDDMFNALKKYNLEVGFLTGAYQNVFKDHLNGFIKGIDEAANNKVQRPLYINCHSGRDYYNFEQGKAFVDHTIALSKSTGIRICHETHRARLMYAAPVTRQYLEKIPGLRLTFDVSHWCNVHESLLEDQAETVDMALQRVDHVHARIGHPEGPQVNDPRAPEWENTVKAHFAWWDKIAELKKQKGEVFTVLTEFGPADYMPTTPYTRQPLADQWGINVYMMQLLRKRYPS